MKRYDSKFIQDYIEVNKNEVERVNLGIKEDWCNTSDTIFASGKLKKKFFKGNNKVEVMGITGSGWGTPVMEVIAKDGTVQLIDCFFDDGNNISAKEFSVLSWFTKATGSRSYDDAR